MNAQYRLATQPRIQDLSDERFHAIAFMNSYRYIYDPIDLDCNTRVSRPGRTSILTGAGTQGEVHWERMVATRVWRSRVRWTIIRNSWLSMLGFDDMPHVMTWTLTPEARLAYRYLTIAEGRLRLRTCIAAGVDRYQMRHEIRRRLQLPEGMFDLARQACLLGAVEMRHCLWNSYEDEFRDATFAAMHAVDEKTGVAATIGLRYSDGWWRLMDVRGKCNQPMDRSWHALGLQIRKMFNESGDASLAL